MGTDIYTHVEVLDNDGKWQEVRVPNKLGTYSDGTVPPVHAIEDRDYNLFGILSNGVRSYEYPSIDEFARGIPADASKTVKEAYEEMSDCRNGASWYSLKELELWAENKEHFIRLVYDDDEGDDAAVFRAEDKDMLERFKKFVHSVEFVALLDPAFHTFQPEKARVVFWFDC